MPLFRILFSTLQKGNHIEVDSRLIGFRFRESDRLTRVGYYIGYGFYSYSRRAPRIMVCKIRGAGLLVTLSA